MKTRISIVIAVLALLAGCAASLQTQTQSTSASASGSISGTADPAPAPTSGLIARITADFQNASVRAKDVATSAKDPSVQKLSSDRALCYDTILVHLGAAATSSAAETKAEGLWDAEEKGIELKDRLQSSGGSGLIPLDVQANCASYEAQKSAAVIAVGSAFARVMAMLGIK
jgi:hypothetical protein